MFVNKVSGLTIRSVFILVLFASVLFAGNSNWTMYRQYANQTCVDHSCKQKEKPECTQDSNCPNSQICDSGFCKELTGNCGQAKDHKFIPYGYECGTESGCPVCPSGLSCDDHKCVQLEVKCPASGLVGEKKTCQAIINGKSCVTCDYIVTDPNGKILSGKSDDNGNFDLLLTTSGNYKIALSTAGGKTIEVKATSPTSVGQQSNPQGSSPMSWVWVIGLLIIIVGGILYWRGRNLPPSGPKKYSK